MRRPLSKLFLVIPMDEFWFDGTLGRDECWTVEGQIVEVPKPWSIDVVYVTRCPMPGENERYPVSGIRLAE